MDDDRLAQLARQLELGLEQALLPVRRRVVAEEIESRLPHRDRLVVLKQIAQLVDAVRLAPAGLVRVDAERRERLVMPLGERERRPARLDARCRP